MKVSFRQGKGEKSKSSLDTGLIQTAEDEKGMNMSECKSHSDRTKQKTLACLNASGRWAMAI